MQLKHCHLPVTQETARNLPYLITRPEPKKAVFDYTTWIELCLLEHFFVYQYSFTKNDWLTHHSMLDGI